MHRLPSTRAVTHFKLASWSLFLMWLLILPTLGIIACAYFLIDTSLMEIALCLMVATATVALFQWVLSQQARCPLCRSRSMGGDPSSKQRKAKRLFGSYRLRVAATVIFSNYFCCPYCGESTSIEARTASCSKRRSY